MSVYMEKTTNKAILSAFYIRQTAMLNRRFAQAENDAIQRKLASFWNSIPEFDQGQSLSLLSILESNPQDPPSSASLKLQRLWLILNLIHGESQSLLSTPNVCRLMSEFAALAMRGALSQASQELTERFGTPLDQQQQPQDLIAMAMGKTGADELNVSSDLDIVFLHRSSTYPKGETSKGFDSTEVLEKIARRAVQILNDDSQEGFVFRMDVRLRPFGDDGPYICSLGMLEEYLVTQGREWERLAWMKAQPLASTQFGSDDQRAQDLKDLENILTPFVFRRYLDFQAIDALRDLHSKIRAEAGKKRIALSSFDVKLGRGGIREIEFISQLFQIIRGGKQPQLRSRSTVRALELLAIHDILPKDQVRQLIDAYWFWRSLEHFLQYRDDQQTHRLEEAHHADSAQWFELETIAFQKKYQQLSDDVAAIFDLMLGQQPTKFQDGSTSTNTHNLSPNLGGDLSPNLSPTFTLATVQFIDALRQSRRYRQAPISSQERIEELLQSTDIDLNREEPAKRFIGLIESLAGRPSYLTLLTRYPVVKQRVFTLLSKAYWASQYLQTHPIVLDELMGDGWLAPVEYNAWADQTRMLVATTDVERALDVLREAHHAQVFRLLAQDIEGFLSTEKLSDHLSLLADYAVQLTLELAWRQLQQSGSKRWLKADKPKFAVIAYGKLGGKELGYASDLDLVFIYSKEDDNENNAEETYAILAQRLSNYLSLRTAAGQLFEVDTRLRPNGASGLLAVSIESFEKYQLEKAWVWEHQALTRARFCCGDPELGKAFEAIRSRTLAQPRELNALSAEIAEMRQKMRDGHPNKTNLFDIKHDQGGMVDIEFFVQKLVLSYAHQYPDLSENKGNIALLLRAAEHGLIDKSMAEDCANAYRRYRQTQHAIRLNDSTDGHAACRTESSLFVHEIAAVNRLKLS